MYEERMHFLGRMFVLERTRDSRNPFCITECIKRVARKTSHFGKIKRMIKSIGMSLIGRDCSFRGEDFYDA